MSNYSDLQTFYKGLRSIVVPTAVTQLGLAGLYTQGQSGSMTPAQQAQWERTIEEALKRKQRRQFRKSITPISKEHSAVPPRQGLMWDPVKKRWTRPENVGHTVVEVQGRKRFRGTGTGAHEQSLARDRAGGKGAGSMEAGRRFRGLADAGLAKPHQSKHVSMQNIKHDKSARRKLQSLMRQRKHR